MHSALWALLAATLVAAVALLGVLPLPVPVNKLVLPLHIAYPFCPSCPEADAAADEIGLAHRAGQGSNVAAAVVMYVLGSSADVLEEVRASASTRACPSAPQLEHDDVVTPSFRCSLTPARVAAALGSQAAPALAHGASDCLLLALNRSLASSGANVTLGASIAAQRAECADYMASRPERFTLSISALESIRGGGPLPVKSFCEAWAHLNETDVALVLDGGETLLFSGGAPGGVRRAAVAASRGAALPGQPTVGHAVAIGPASVPAGAETIAPFASRIPLAAQPTEDFLVGAPSDDESSGTDDSADDSADDAARADLSSLRAEKLAVDAQVARAFVQIESTSALGAATDVGLSFIEREALDRAQGSAARARRAAASAQEASLQDPEDDALKAAAAAVREAQAAADEHEQCIQKSSDEKERERRSSTPSTGAVRLTTDAIVLNEQRVTAIRSALANKEAAREQGGSCMAMIPLKAGSRTSAAGSPSLVTCSKRSWAACASLCGERVEERRERRGARVGRVHEGAAPGRPAVLRVPHLTRRSCPLAHCRIAARALLHKMEISRAHPESEGIEGEARSSVRSRARRHARTRAPVARGVGRAARARAPRAAGGHGGGHRGQVAARASGRPRADAH